MVAVDFLTVFLVGLGAGIGVVLAGWAAQRRFRAWREARVEWDPY